MIAPHGVVFILRKGSIASMPKVDRLYPLMPRHNEENVEVWPYKPFFPDSGSSINGYPDGDGFAVRTEAHFMYRTFGRIIYE